MRHHNGVKQCDEQRNDRYERDDREDRDGPRTESSVHVHEKNENRLREAMARIAGAANAPSAPPAIAIRISTISPSMRMTYTAAYFASSITIHHLTTDTARGTGTPRPRRPFPSRSRRSPRRHSPLSPSPP